MKKMISSIMLLTIALCAKASVYDSIAFPDHVIARAISNSGQITTEYISDFIYGTDGQLTNYTFYTTTDDCQGSFSFYEYPSKPSQSLFEFYNSVEPMTVYEKYTFQYENGITKHKEAWRHADFFDFHYYWDYEYENLHLCQEDYKSYEYHDVYRTRHVYSYSDGYKTRIDQYYEYYDEPEPHLSTVTTNHYNNRQQILTSQTDSNQSGEIIPNSLKTYTYTPLKKTDSIITQTYNNGTWVNSKIAHYVYDSLNRIVEYQTGTWSVEDQNWNINQKIIWDFNDETQTLTISFRKKNGDEWEWDKFRGQSLFNDSRLYEWQRALNSCFYGGRDVNQFEISMHYDRLESGFIIGMEWYYNIIGDNGSITYQHLECTADTTINEERPKVIVRSNTQYDRDTLFTEITHEYVYEKNGKVYWWNKDLEEFTTLYDYNADTGNEWEIKVGMESIIVHVDSVGIFEYDGETRKMLHISDAGNIFNGDIVVGYGHMTSFFPEKLMRRDAGFTVNGLRCYWVEDALLYHNGDEDCDAIYSDIHSIDEDGPSTPSTGSGTAGALVVYPNPTNGVLFVETRHGTSLPDPTYQISNLMGQTVLSGSINTDKQQINIANLPEGMYFISVGEQTMKFVVK